MRFEIASTSLSILYIYIDIAVAYSTPTLDTYMYI